MADGLPQDEARALANASAALRAYFHPSVWEVVDEELQKAFDARDSADIQPGDDRRHALQGDLVKRATIAIGLQLYELAFAQLDGELQHWFEPSVGARKRQKGAPQYKDEYSFIREAIEALRKPSRTGRKAPRSIEQARAWLEDRAEGKLSENENRGRGTNPAALLDGVAIQQHPDKDVDGDIWLELNQESMHAAYEWLLKKAELSKEQREILRQTYFEGKKGSEIRLPGVLPKRIYYLHKKAIAALRVAVLKLGVDDAGSGPEIIREIVELYLNQLRQHVH